MTTLINLLLAAALIVVALAFILTVAVFGTALGTDCWLQLLPVGGISASIRCG